MKSLIVGILLMSQPAQAFLVRPEVGYNFFKKYEVNNVLNEFETSGVDVGVSFFSSDEFSRYIDSASFDWITGIGINYGSLRTKSLTGSPLNLPEIFDFHLIKLQAIVGFAFYGLRVEVPLAGLFLKEKTDPNAGDEKYGWGLGIQILYPFESGLVLGLGLEKYTFENGKNASTGLQGSLANVVNITGPRLILAYNFQWSIL